MIHMQDEVQNQRDLKIPGIMQVLRRKELVYIGGLLCKDHRKISGQKDSVYSMGKNIITDI